MEIKRVQFYSVSITFKVIRIAIFICAIVLTTGWASYTKGLAHHREEYKTEFINDPRSPLDSTAIDSLDFWPAEPKARVKAKFVATPQAEPFEMPTYSGVTRTYRQWGTATCVWEGKEVSLALYENMTLRSNPIYKDYLFLPFKDETNGVTTYGGGRYLNMSKADTEDGNIVIDFNTCYNPWCAYSDGFNCPIPPVVNHLSFEVKAGEKKYLGAVKKSVDE